MVKMKEMSILCIFMLSVVVNFCQSNLFNSKSKRSKLSINTPEPYTTIFLGDEAYSIEAVRKKLKAEPINMLHRGKQKTAGGQHFKQNFPNLEENTTKGLERAHSSKKGKPASLETEKENVLADNKKYNHFRWLRNSKNSHHQKRSHDIKRKLRRRNFDAPSGNVWNFGESGQVRFQTVKDNNPIYPSALNIIDVTTISWNSDTRLRGNSLDAVATNKITQNGDSSSEDFLKNSDDMILEQGEKFRIYRPDKPLQTSSTSASALKINSAVSPWTEEMKFSEKRENDSMADGYYQQNRIPNTNFPIPVATVPWPITTVPSFYDESQSQGNIVQRNTSADLQQRKSDREKLENQLQTDDIEPDDDTSVVFEGGCDEIVNDTCWMTREVGDVVTLLVNIDSSKNPKSFQVRWLKVYHVYDSVKGRPLEIEPGKLPWNMVSGSEGRELRLHPIANTDVDPNCIVAKIFMLTKEGEKVLFTFIKRLIFRIEIPIIDMGKLYAGEELSINLESFMSLPARGNMLFHWNLETKPHEIRSLPSHIKVSHSGRSVILKELKKGTLGVLNCIIYSSNRYAVAKRRFNILNIGESVKRRSTKDFPRDDRLASLRSSHRCRRFIRKSRARAMQRLEEGKKPKSRKKRYRRMDSGFSELDCEPLRKKIYSRWIRSLFGEYTTVDPRLMSLEKLFELSEEGDGTLDDVIPHEIHYVQPEVRVVSGTSGERSIGQLHAVQNCTSSADCGNNAVCAVSQDGSVPTGQCLCRSEFYGDGLTCHKIPSSTHREKRLRREAREEFIVPKNLFYEQIRNAATSTEPPEQQNGDADVPVKVLSFEEEESFLLSDCTDDKDCSGHARCVQPSNGHPYCRCRRGFRGNGIFCWEIVDYVPQEENLFPDEEINPKGNTLLPDMSVFQQAFNTPISGDMGDD